MCFLKKKKANKEKNQSNIKENRADERMIRDLALKRSGQPSFSTEGSRETSMSRCQNLSLKKSLLVLPIAQQTSMDFFKDKFWHWLMLVSLLPSVLNDGCPDLFNARSLIILNSNLQLIILVLRSSNHPGKTWLR